MTYQFPKNEKLKSRKLIEALFKEGKTLKSFPLLVYFLPIEHTSEALLQVGFSVPKRRFKHAVDRNRIKRLMREAYRLNKNMLPEKHTKKHIVMFIYQGQQILDFQGIQKAMISVLEKI